jgi:hypothetical protein
MDFVRNGFDEVLKEVRYYIGLVTAYYLIKSTFLHLNAFFTG